MAQSFVGKTIGKYQIVEMLGRGGMAEVFKGYQPGLDRYVAVKLMHSFLADDEGFLGRFQREARAVASLRHPNIVQVYDFDVADGVYYMVMEFIDGGTLKDVLQELAAQNRTMPLSEAVRITRGIASALAYAHQRDMVHRDVKPANVMMNRDRTPILTDFGIAKILSGPQYTASGAMVGTPAYMSPEQGLGKPGDARSDIYSLGTMFFQMVTGQLPYDADTPLAVVLKHVNEPMPIPSRINPAVPQAAERVIFKAMAKNPEDRYQSADQLIGHLDRLLTGQEIPEADQPTTVAPRPTGAEPGATIVAGPGRAAAGARPAVKPAKPKKSALPWVALGALLVTAIVAGAAIVMFGLLGPGRATPTPELAVVPVSDTATPSITPQPTTTGTPAASPTPLDLVGAASTALAIQNATLTAQAPTPTPIPSATPQPSPTPMPLCQYAAQPGPFFTYDNPRGYNPTSNQTSAPTNSLFPLTIQVLNSGTCVWPSGTMLVFLEGERLGAKEVAVLDDQVPAGSTAEFDLQMQSGAQTGLQSSVWKVETGSGETIGDPFEVRVAIYVPPTATPVVTVRPATAPPPTQPPATATTQASGPIDFNYFVHDCEYAGSDWRCWLTITPFGGIGQPYTIFVFDSAQPARYYGGNADHLLMARRCFPWVHEVKLQDDGGNSISKNVYISPNDYFAGGCTEP